MIPDVAVALQTASCSCNVQDVPAGSVIALLRRMATLLATSTDGAAHNGEDRLALTYIAESLEDIEATILGLYLGKT